MSYFLKLFLSSFVICMASNLYSQSDWLITYTFESYQGTFSEITEGNVHASGPDIDQQVYNDIPLPFTFNYNGTDHDQIALHPNGFLVFGGPIEPGYHFQPISGNSSVSPNTHNEDTAHEPFTYFTPIRCTPTAPTRNMLSTSAGTGWAVTLMAPSFN